MTELNPIHLLTPQSVSTEPVLNPAQTRSKPVIDSQSQFNPNPRFTILSPSQNIHAESFGAPPHFFTPQNLSTEPTFFSGNLFRYPNLLSLQMLKQPFLTNELTQQLGILWMMQSSKKLEKKEISEETTTFYYIQESGESEFDEEHPSEETVDIAKEFVQYEEEILKTK